MCPTVELTWVLDLFLFRNSKLQNYQKHLVLHHHLFTSYLALKFILEIILDFHPSSKQEKTKNYPWLKTQGHMNVTLKIAYPDDSMTGSWSKPSLFMIESACSTLSSGKIVKGADNSREETFSSNHLKSLEETYKFL